MGCLSNNLSVVLESHPPFLLEELLKQWHLDASFLKQHFAFKRTMGREGQSFKDPRIAWILQQLHALQSIQQYKLSQYILTQQSKQDQPKLSICVKYRSTNPYQFLCSYLTFVLMFTMLRLQMNWMLSFSMSKCFCLRQVKTVVRGSFGPTFPTIFTEIFSDESIDLMTKNTLSESLVIYANLWSSSFVLTFDSLIFLITFQYSCRLWWFLKGQLIKQSGLHMSRSVVKAAVETTAFSVVFPVQYTTLAPNLVIQAADLQPNMAMSLRAETVTTAPPTNAAGVTTVRSNMAMECISFLSMKGGRKGTIISIMASIAIVPYFIICSFIVSSMGDSIKQEILIISVLNKLQAQQKVKGKGMLMNTKRREVLNGWI